MARHRSIDQDTILDAAEMVVAHDGAASLSLTAVATAAKVSKASVLYDYKTKDGLIRAVVERRAQIERAALDRAGAGTGERIAAHIALAEEELPNDTRSVTLGLCSAVIQNKELFDLVREYYAKEVERIMDTSFPKHRVRLAFLALEGLKAVGFLGFTQWSQNEREDILNEIRWLLEMDPA